MPTPPALSARMTVIFNTLQRAFRNGDVCLLSVLDKDNKPAALICMINFEDGQYELVPIARMIEGNPYEQFQAPGGA